MTNVKWYSLSCTRWRETVIHDTQPINQNKLNPANKCNTLEQLSASNLNEKWGPANYTPPKVKVYGKYFYAWLPPNNARVRLSCYLYPSSLSWNWSWEARVNTSWEALSPVRTRNLGTSIGCKWKKSTYFWIFLIRGFFLFLFFKESWLGNKAVWLTHSIHLVILQNVRVQKGEQEKPWLVCTFQYFDKISPTCQNTKMKFYGRGQMLSSVYFTTPIVAINVFCSYLPYIPLYWAVLSLSASPLAGMNLLSSSDIICIFIKSTRADCRIFRGLHHPPLTQWTCQGCCGLQYECKSPFVIFVKFTFYFSCCAVM